MPPIPTIQNGSIKTIKVISTLLLTTRELRKFTGIEIFYTIPEYRQGKDHFMLKIKVQEWIDWKNQQALIRTNRTL